MTLSLIVPVLNNFKVFAECMATVDYPVQPIIMDNWVENRGVSGAWNEGMKKSLQYGNKYALISNDDASFTPGAIKELYDTIRYTKAVIVSPNQNGKNLAESFTLESNADFFCFIVDIEQLVEKVGWFDENFFPAYFEDNDMHRRIRLAGLKNYVRKDVRVNHIGSATQFFDPNNPVVDARKWDYVQGYYMSKWGGLPDQETYTNPFNNPRNDLKYWENR